MDEKSNPLPVLLSIPHCGSAVPEELRDKLNLGRYEMLFEGDAFTEEIYNLGPRVQKVLCAEVSRALVDLNRPPELLPPECADGVLKDVTTYGVQVYKEGKGPNLQLTQRLLARYYEPYHRALEEAVNSPGLVLALDCHSMAALGPPLAKDKGQRRPAICLGNGGGQTCSEDTLLRLRECFAQAFSLSEQEVSLNKPFSGGYIVRRYGYKPLPWVQVEISRGLYLQEPWFDRTTLSMDKKRLLELRGMFEKALTLFFEGESEHCPGSRKNGKRDKDLGTRPRLPVSL